MTNYIAFLTDINTFRNAKVVRRNFSNGDKGELFTHTFVSYNNSVRIKVQ